MCSLRESKFTELIELDTLVKAVAERGEVENCISQREELGGPSGERETNDSCRKGSSVVVDIGSPQMAGLATCADMPVCT